MGFFDKLLGHADIGTVAKNAERFLSEGENIIAAFKFFRDEIVVAEQHRIVAKVDQFMALCDELESKLTAARERAERLVGAVVGSTAFQ